MEVERQDITPHVTIGVIPKIGQQFQSHEEALEFYNTYARQAGFSTRIDNSNKDKITRDVVWKMFVCSKEGKTDETYQNKLKNSVERSGNRNRGHTRCGCLARMSVSKSKSDQMWYVSYFVENHNHVLTTPSKVHLLKSHRKVSATKKALVKQFTEANVPTCQQVRLLEIEAGGPSSIGCLEMDIRNHERDVRSELFGHDAETLIEYFEMEKEKNENFYFAYETDDTGAFVRCFWADCETKRSYAHFGDTLVFDTTYNTNKYGMIFAPFVGVNHHRKTVVFGCGLLSDEKIESFVWLFKRSLEAMPTHVQPRVIITDQDAAISRAVSEVFIGILHKFCLWHIFNKFSVKLSVLLYKEKYHTLVDVIKESESTDEFERRWTELMDSTELGKNEWLGDMYEIRQRWVPVYVKHVFAAGMSSSQRVESNHSFFKRFVNRKNSLADFITRFNRALVHQRHVELFANHIDLSEVPRMVTGCLMEQQMSRIYTKTMFLLFQKQLQNSMTNICTLISSSDATSVYEVKRFELGGSFQRKRELTHHISPDFISCSCRMLEFKGYPCSHILCWMRVNQVMMLPEKYIMQRWTKNAKSTKVSGMEINVLKGTSLILRRGTLARITMDLVDEFSLTKARSNFLMTELQNLKIRAKDIDDGGDIVRQMAKAKNRDVTEVVRDPHHVNTKGSSGKRIKSSKEMAMSKSNRACSVCDKIGHNKQTCPTVHSTYAHDGLMRRNIENSPTLVHMSVIPLNE